MRILRGVEVAQAGYVVLMRVADHDGIGTDGVVVDVEGRVEDQRRLGTVHDDGVSVRERSAVRGCEHGHLVEAGFGEARRCGHLVCLPARRARCQ